MTISYLNSKIRMPIHLYIVILVVLILPSVFLSSQAIKAVYTIDAYQKQDYNYIAIHNNSGGDFFALDNNYAGTGGRYVTAGIYMPSSQHQALDGLFVGKDSNTAVRLGANECLISKRLAVLHRIKIGGSITLTSTALLPQDDIAFKVVGYLPSVDSVNNNFVKKGIIVVGHNSKVNTADKKTITFQDHLNGGASEYIYKSRLIQELKVQLLQSFLWLLAASLLAVLGIELLFQRHKLDNYILFRHKGMKGGKLLKIILAELCLKYAIPFVAVGAVTSIVHIAYYGWIALVYTALLLGCLAVQIAAMCIYYFARSRR